jgi:signal transduction histidine kinase
LPLNDTESLVLVKDYNLLSLSRYQQKLKIRFLKILEWLKGIIQRCLEICKEQEKNIPIIRQPKDKGIVDKTTALDKQKRRNKDSPSRKNQIDRVVENLITQIENHRDHV